MPEGRAPLGHRGTGALQRLIEYAPASGALALWARHEDLPVDVAAPALATDGLTLFYGAAFDALPLALQTGSVARGVLHIALRHAQRLSALRQRLGEVDETLYALCANAIVASTLAPVSWMQLPDDGPTLEQLLAQALRTDMSVEDALLRWDVESLYVALDDRTRRTGKRGGRTDGPRAARARALAAGRGGDRVLLPAPDGPPQAETEACREWTQRLQRAHAGDGVFSMLRMLGAGLAQPRMPWEQLLRTRLAHGLSRRRASTWSRPSRSYLANQGRAGPQRRMPFEPGFSSSSAVPRVALIVDVSGSIDTALLQRFATEMVAISRRLESEVLLIAGDDQVRHVELLPAGALALRHIEPVGGGDTDFAPLLAEAGRHRPDMAVVLTDLEGPAGPRPPWPVIWAVPSRSAPPAPFGTRLVLNT
jgi:predicted metal-dependent peptidase